VPALDNSGLEWETQAQKNPLVEQGIAPVIMVEGNFRSHGLSPRVNIGLIAHLNWCASVILVFLLGHDSPNFNPDYGESPQLSTWKDFTSVVFNPFDWRKNMSKTGKILPVKKVGTKALRAAGICLADWAIPRRGKKRAKAINKQKKKEAQARIGGIIADLTRLHRDLSYCWLLSLWINPIVGQHQNEW